MRMDVGLFQQQTTKLVMTTELRQAISLLQYSALDLSHYIQEQALENPLIELEENRAELVEERRQPKLSDTELARGPYRDSEEKSPLDFISVEKTGIHEHLLEQLFYLRLPKKDEEVVKYFILNLNEDGYLTRPLTEFAETFAISEEEALDYLYIIQNMEPAGVGARNVSECLLIQLLKRKERDYLAEIIVENYMEMFAQKKWKELSKELSVTMQEIQQVYDTIQLLDPRPGNQYSSELTSYIVPDVIVEEENGEWIITVNDQYIPKIHFNEQYRSLLKAEKQSDLQQYVKEKYDELQWLLKSIHQRKWTLFQVAEAIVHFQADFLREGDKALKPLTLKEVADKIEVHESTVSRATTNKYIQTPRGVYPFKHFFSSKTKEGGTSSTSVKEYIQKLIEAEDKLKPLSDQKIVELLKEKENISVSRRVIAKYRDELNIPSSSKRKRFE